MTRLIGVLMIAAALALAGCGGNDGSGASSGSSSSGSSGSSGSSSSGSSGSSSSGSSGSSDASSSSGGGGQTLQLAADPAGGLSFDKKTLTAKAGEVTVDFTNDSSTTHAVAVEGNGLDQAGKAITKGKDSLTLTLKQGTYTFYCPVPGHRQAGMEGTLTVK